MKKINERIIIMDGTSKTQLLKAIKFYEDYMGATIITVFVGDNHYMIYSVYDEIGIYKYCCKVEDFINKEITRKFYSDFSELINTI